MLTIDQRVVLTSSLETPQELTSPLVGIIELFKLAVIKPHEASLIYCTCMLCSN